MKRVEAQRRIRPDYLMEVRVDGVWYRACDLEFVGKPALLPEDAVGCYVNDPCYWQGSEVARCDICGVAFDDYFVDGATQYGRRWARMCLVCHGSVGLGVGVGLGQVYREYPEGWLKVGG